MKKIITVIIICFLLFSCSIVTNKNELTNPTFTYEKWENEPYKRIHIVDDLLEKYDLTSMTKDEVLKLLGEKECYISEQNINYTLGKDKTLFFMYLDILFDEEGRVTSFRIYQD